MARERRAVPGEQPRTLALGHPRLQPREDTADAVGGLTGRPLEGRDLVDLVDHPQPVGGVDQEVGRVLDEP